MIFSSISKSIKLKRTSKVLGAPITLSIDNLLNKQEEEDRALDELYLLAKNYKYTNNRLKKYHIDNKRFKEIYRALLIAGAGQWVKGHYVAASSLVFGTTLEYILERLDKGKQKDWQDIAYKLIEYFQKRKIGKESLSISADS